LGVRAERFALGAPKSPQTKFSKPYLRLAVRTHVVQSRSIPPDLQSDLAARIGGPNLPGHLQQNFDQLDPRFQPEAELAIKALSSTRSLRRGPRR